jgi:hypothetical protein
LLLYPAKIEWGWLSGGPDSAETASPVPTVTEQLIDELLSLEPPAAVLEPATDLELPVLEPAGAGQLLPLLAASWADDPDFDLHRHLRDIGLPALRLVPDRDCGFGPMARRGGRFTFSTWPR